MWDIRNLSNFWTDTEESQFWVCVAGIQPGGDQTDLISICFLYQWWWPQALVSVLKRKNRRDSLHRKLVFPGNYKLLRHCFILLPCRRPTRTTKTFFLHCFILLRTPYALCFDIWDHRERRNHFVLRAGDRRKLLWLFFALYHTSTASGFLLSSPVHAGCFWILDVSRGCSSSELGSFRLAPSTELHSSRGRLQPRYTSNSYAAERASLKCNPVFLCKRDVAKEWWSV